MSDTFADLLACEDVLTFASAAVSGTGQSEFHTGREEQRLSLDFLHAYIHETLPDLYAAVLALHVNDHNAAHIVHRLLRSPRPEAPAKERDRENALIRRRLTEMPPQRVYRLFRRLAAERVNNRRTRAVMREWLAARPGLDLDAVKYRRGLRAAVRHAHFSLPEEVARFVFSPAARRRRGHYASSLLRSHVRAHHSARDLYALPFTVAEGFAARHRVPRARFLELIRERTTRAERLRLEGSARRHGARTSVELSGTPLLTLCSYVLSLSPGEREQRREELETALREAALRAAGRRARTWPRTAIVLDDSYSSLGSPAKPRGPLAVALACHHLVHALAPEAASHWVSGRTDALTVVPDGPTHLVEPILDALKHTPERVLVVSDGYDATPPLLADALTVWRRQVDPARRTSMVHLNPVLDADLLGMRALSPAVPTVGVRDPLTVPSLVGLARFGEGDLGLAELRAHMEAAVDAYLEGAG